MRAVTNSAPALCASLLSAAGTGLVAAQEAPSPAITVAQAQPATPAAATPAPAATAPVATPGATTTPVGTPPMATPPAGVAPPPAGVTDPAAAGAYPAQTTTPGAYPTPATAYPQPGAAYPQPGAAYPQPGAAYPGQPGYGAYPGQPGAAPGYPPQVAMGQAPSAHPIRQLFAGTLSALVSGLTGGVVGSVTQGVTGSITNWFNRKQMQAAGAVYNPYGQPTPGYPTTGYPSTYPQPTTAYPGTTSYPSTATTSYPASTTYPQSATTTYPATTSTYPQAATTTYPPTATAYPGATTYPQTATTTYPQTASTTYPQSTTTYPQSASTYPQTATYPQPTTTYPTTTAYPSTDPTLAQAGTVPQTAIPGQAAIPGQTAIPGQPVIPTQTLAYAQSAPTAVYDPRTGQMTTAAVSAYPSTPAAGTAAALYAGVAYEVHAIGPGGVDTPVNAATYTFHSGDQFKVYFRPSMPGHMDVYNVNPLGQQKRIDSVEIAAGQLTALGPYQFTATTGDESLRLVLSPCSTNQLLASTRDIINVSTTTGSPLTLGSCTNLGSRGLSGVKTRDIEKVAVDGSTSFALDPVTQAELAAGQLAPREIPIYFHHM